MHEHIFTSKARAEGWTAWFWDDGHGLPMSASVRIVDGHIVEAVEWIGPFRGEPWKAGGTSEEIRGPGDVDVRRLKHLARGRGFRRG